MVPSTRAFSAANTSSARPASVAAKLTGFAASTLLCLLVVASSSAAQTTTYSATKTIPAPPASSYAGSGGGDGWGLSFSPTQVFNVFHHSGQITVACHRQSDAAECWSPRTVTDANGLSFESSGHSGTYFDDGTNRLYVYATRDGDATAGVVCIDTVAAATNPNPFCGYTPLTPPGDAQVNGFISATSVPMLVGNRWFSFNYVSGSGASGGRNKLLCFNVTTKAACSGQPFSVPIGAGSVSVGTFPVPATAAIGSRVIIPINVDGNSKLACFDASTNANCAGSWPAPLSFPYGNGSPFPKLDANGQINGLCLPTGTDQCYSLSGASVATPPNMTTAIDASQPWNGPAYTLGSRVYVPTGTRNVVECYDYSASAQCANFPHSLPGAGYMYTVNQDPQRPTCIWINADNGGAQIQNFDAFTGGACGEGAIRVLASQIVVPQEKCRPTAYKTFQVLDPARNEYANGTVAFRDGNGNPIPGASERALDINGAVDLTGLGLESVTGLPQFLITLNGTQGAVGEVVVKLTWTATYDPDCIGPGTTVAQKPTTVTTSLSGGGKTGAKITVAPGTAVKDTATLGGDNHGSAGGTVKYTVYSDSSCSNAVYTGPNQSITTPGTLPDSAPVTFNNPGTYYWVASYSGDGSNFSSKSACGDEVETVSGGGPTGPNRMVTNAVRAGATYASIVDCELATANAKHRPFIVSYQEGSTTHRFVTTTFNLVKCSNDPNVPTSAFGYDTQIGDSFGTLDGAAGYELTWKVQDAGSSGDKTGLLIKKVSTGAVIKNIPLGTLSSGQNTALGPA